MPTASGRGLLKASGQRAASIALIRIFISWCCMLFSVSGALRWPAALSVFVGGFGAGAAGAGAAGVGARLAIAARIPDEAVRVLRPVIRCLQDRRGGYR